MQVTVSAAGMMDGEEAVDAMNGMILSGVGAP
jgi:hypothetical protein